MDASFIPARRGPIAAAPAFSLPGTPSILGRAAAVHVVADRGPVARVRRWLEWWREEEAWPEAAAGTGGAVG